MAGWTQRTGCVWITIAPRSWCSRCWTRALSCSPSYRRSRAPPSAWSAHHARVHGREGLLSLRAGSRGRFLGVTTATHDRALGIVYGAALAGWVYLVGWGTLAAFGVDGAQEGGAVIGAVAGLAVLYDIERLGRSATEAGERSITGEEGRQLA
ncbi:MAG: hypothetical protein ACRDPM_00725 [Solirubrobacteraceae bacterium]